MLTQEENEILTRVEGDAPMGQMMRNHHWIPAIRAGAITGDPIRIRLFGDDFVAFRADDGRIGFLNEACPHRRASLALARHEGCALRCIFHGWKIDVSAKVVEVPNEPGDGGRFAANVPVRHYPTQVAGNILWVWLGTGEPAAFPEFPFTQLPDDHVFVASTKIPVNYAQAIEATLDSSHIAFLHRDWLGDLGGDAFKGTGQSLAPRFEIRDTIYGYRGAALRDLGDGTVLARLNEFVLPFHSSTSPGKPNQGAYQIMVPIDDTHTLWYFVGWDTGQPYDSSGSILGAPGADIDNWFPQPGTRENNWGQDREAMRNGTSFAGFPTTGLLTEDTVIEISMGAIVDRTKEVLCRGDLAIVRMRSLLIRAARDYAAGRQPFGTDASIPYHNLYAVAGTMDASEDWLEHFHNGALEAAE